MNSSMTILEEETMDAFIADKDCMVLFYKKICPHCKVLSTVLVKCKEAAPKLFYAGVDSEAQPALMERFGVERVPTLLAFKDGQLRAKKTGLMNPRETMDFFSKA